MQEHLIRELLEPFDVPVKPISSLEVSALIEELGLVPVSMITPTVARFLFSSHEDKFISLDMQEQIERELIAIRETLVGWEAEFFDSRLEAYVEKYCSRHKIPQVYDDYPNLFEQYEQVEQ